MRRRYGGVFHLQVDTISFIIFEDGMMRSPDKAELRKKILLKEAIPDLRDIYANDGGMVLHKTS